MRKVKNSQSGFSLVELLVVVAIMLTIAAIAVPAIISSNQAGNETAAAHNLRQLVTAEVGYRQLSGQWSPLAANLGGGANCPTQPDNATTPPSYSCLLPTEVATAMDAGTIGNYKFTYAPDATVGWKATAIPSTDSAGRKAFYVDATGTIRYVAGGASATPDVTAKPLGQ